MTVMYGADADELERLAGEFIRAADELDGEGKSLTGILNRVSWLGDIATRYLDNWTGVQIPKIGLSTQFLRNAADQLQAHATDQRETSRGDHSLGVGGLPLTLGDYRLLYQRLQQIFNELAPTLDRMRTQSPEEQSAWWNSLTEEQQAVLIALQPVHVLTLAGLSDADRQRARDQYASAISDEIVTGVASIDAKIEVDVRLANAEIGFELEKTTFRDGHVEVTFSGDTGVGGTVKIAKILAERGLAGTYTFESEAEYQAFMNSMMERVTDDFNITDSGLEIAAYLAENGDHFKSVEISVGASVTLEAEAPGQYKASLEAGGTLAAEYNRLDGTTTLSAAGHVDASGSLTPLGIKASGGVEVTGAVTLKDGAATSVSLSFEYEGSASFDLLGGAPGLEKSLGVDHSGRATITFDLTDPVVREQFSAVTAAMERGDVKAALASAGRFANQGEVVIQQFAGVTDHSGIDAKVVSGEVNFSGRVATSTYVKPPGSPMFALK